MLPVLSSRSGPEAKKLKVGDHVSTSGSRYWTRVAQPQRRRYHRAYQAWSGRASNNLHITRTHDGAGSWICSVLGLYGSTQQTACGVGYESAIFNTRTNARISFTFHRGLRVRVHTRTTTWTTLEPARPSLVRSVISAPLRLCHTRPIAGSGCGDMVAHLQLFGFRARSTRQHRQHLSDLRRKHRFFEIRALALKKIRSAQSDRLHAYLEGLMVCTRQAWYLLSAGSVSFILILDLRMRKKDGLEAVGERMSHRPRPPIIVFTNSDKATDIWRALPAGDKG